MMLDEAANDIVAVTPVGRYTAMAVLQHMAPANGLKVDGSPDYSVDWADYVQPARDFVRAALSQSVDARVQIYMLMARVAKLEKGSVSVHNNG